MQTFPGVFCFFNPDNGSLLQVISYVYFENVRSCATIMQINSVGKIGIQELQKENENAL